MVLIRNFLQSAVEMVMLREEPGIPNFDEVDLWLNQGKKMGLRQGEVRRCLDLLGQF